MTRQIKFGYEMEFLAKPIESRNNGMRTTYESVEQTSYRYAKVITDATGIAVASESYSHGAVTTDFKLVTDASVRCCSEITCRCHLHGLELVSRPYTNLSEFTSHLRQIKRVMSKLGVTINHRCGLHVHHDIATNDIDKDGIIKLNRYYAQSDHLIASLIGKERLHNGYCKPYTRRDGEFNDTRDIEVLLKYEQSIREEALYTHKDDDYVSRLRLNGIGWMLSPDSTNRYRNVNVNAKNRHKTLEFRAMQSTLDIDDTVRWIEFTNALMYKAKSFKVLDTFARRTPTRDNVESMFNKLQLDFYDYKEFYN